MAKKPLDKADDNVVTMTTETGHESTVESGPPKSVTKNDLPPRRKRTPLTGANRILQIKLPGYVVVASSQDMVQQRLDKDYEFVTHKDVESQTGYSLRRAGDSTDLDSRVTSDGGGGQTLYYMKQRIEFYREDRADAEAEIRKTESAIRRKGEDTFESSVRKSTKGPVEED